MAARAAVAQHAVQQFVAGLPPAALQVLQLINDNNKELRIWLDRRDRQIKKLKQVCVPSLLGLVMSMVPCQAGMLAQFGIASSLAMPCMQT
jgi:hypothetical protein